MTLDEIERKYKKDLEYILVEWERAEQKVKLLGRIIEEAYDKDFGTYDYKAIADKVISLVKDEK